MKKSKLPTRKSACPLNVALEMIGDRWSLLVVRDLMFKDRSTYKELLGAEEGIATNLLADRLQRLESHDIIVKEPDPADGRKLIYRLTPKGIDLAPVLVEMMIWSAQHEETAAPPETIRTMRENRQRFIFNVKKRWAKSTVKKETVTQNPRGKSAK